MHVSGLLLNDARQSEPRIWSPVPAPRHPPLVGAHESFPCLQKSLLPNLLLYALGRWVDQPFMPPIDVLAEAIRPKRPKLFGSSATICARRFGHSPVGVYNSSLDRSTIGSVCDPPK
jgi:hypothetical protein